MIGSDVVKQAVTADGTTKRFAFSIPFLNASAVKVRTAAGASLYDYTVETAAKANDVYPGGTVVFTDAPDAGTLYIYRSEAYTQETVYQAGGALPAKSIEAGLDKLTMQTQQLKEKVDKLIDPEEPALSAEVVLPLDLYAVVGHEANVYFENMVADHAERYAISATVYDGTYYWGEQQEERWKYTPVSSAVDANAYENAFQIYEPVKFNLIDEVSPNVHTASASAKSSYTTSNPLKLLVIGDSLTGSGYLTADFLEFANGVVETADVMKVQLIGTQEGANFLYVKNNGTRYGGKFVGAGTVGSSYAWIDELGNYVYTVSSSITIGTTPVYSDSARTTQVGTFTNQLVVGSNRHEGRNGWTLADYCGNKSGNPFWINGALNFGAYLQNNSLATPNWVIIALGVNDACAQGGDSVIDAGIVSVIAKLDTLITSIKAAGSSIKIGLALPPPGAAEQDAFGSIVSDNLNVQYIKRGRYKRNTLMWCKRFIEKYAYSATSGVYIIPTNVAIDTVHGYQRSTAAPVNARSAETVQRQSDPFHPNASGYYQLADAIWAFLKVQG